MYHDGYGVPSDCRKAIKWYTKSANQGDIAAQYNLGIMYYYGVNLGPIARLQGNYVPQNYSTAAQWFYKAANQRNAKAQFFLGDMYYNGHGVQQDFKEAIKWFKMAAKQGNEKAKKRLKELGEKSQWSWDSLF